MTDLDHARASLSSLPEEARLYLRPTGLGCVPAHDPSAVRRLAGGMAWFGLVHIIARVGRQRRVSVVAPVGEVEALIDGLPAAHRERAGMQWRNLLKPRPALDMGHGKMLSFDRPAVMGILNVTPDSFSDGGKHVDAQVAAETAWAMMKAGAAIIDVGAESTRPGAKPVWEGDEIERMRLLLERLAHQPVPWSADTRKAAVMRYALGQGVGIINDVSALTYDPEAVKVVASSGIPVVLMHHQGDPQTMQVSPAYDDALLDVYDWLEARIDACEAAGIARGKIILDPGIGFGKTVRHNLEILNGLSLFHALGCPILLGVSRKRFIAALSREEPATERLPGSLAIAVQGAAQGVQMFRVHDVPETVQALKVWQGMQDAALMPPGM
ncbi:dihydropteroate synthase [Pedomonas mirosovicensis]|uniref:dihydropteroate synthase n=1 Tax=Pedomonas mirosovicensis TaxID=2908641 RepID=UPI00216718C7|nr:dihydropteroate synthase [Pedomonas mirosovicensis]MCH8684724.1 dihydropteroate synthase [Pedomonas mirosovicensis]